MTVVLSVLSADPLDLAVLEGLVARDDAGAIATFTGRVRNHDHGREVTALDYSAHPSAERVLRDVADEIACTPGVLALAVSHRVGSLVVGDAAIMAAVSSAHRGTAFAACERLVDEVKARVPIWKQQAFADGTVEWVGAC